MKKCFLGVVVSVLILYVGVFFVACTSKNDDNNNKYHTIELTLENYKDYLTFTTYLTDSRIVSGGSLRIASYDVYISGAINGYYENCKLYTASKVINLNVAGCAQTTKTISNGKDNFVITKVEGIIYF